MRRHSRQAGIRRPSRTGADPRPDSRIGDDVRGDDDPRVPCASSSTTSVASHDVRYRFLRDRRHRSRRADRHRPGAAAEGGAHARPPVRPAAALRERRQVGHQPRDGARRTPQAAAAGAIGSDATSRPACRPPRAISSKVRSRSATTSTAPRTSRPHRRRRCRRCRSHPPSRRTLQRPMPAARRRGRAICPASTRSDAPAPWPTLPKPRRKRSSRT